MRNQWEYYIARARINNLDWFGDELKRLGSMGWELVQVLPAENEDHLPIAIFKRSRAIG